MENTSTTSKIEDTKYTYFKIEFEDCGHDFDYTIVEKIQDIADYIEITEGELDDRERDAKIIITGVAMTRKEYDEWQKDNLDPND